MENFMKIAVAKEIEFGERRVALVPDVVARLVKKGVEVLVGQGAGEGSFSPMMPIPLLEQELYRIQQICGVRLT
jgi:hypothetical protein